MEKRTFITLTFQTITTKKKGKTLAPANSELCLILKIANLLIPMGAKEVGDASVEGFAELEPYFIHCNDCTFYVVVLL